LEENGNNVTLLDDVIFSVNSYDIIIVGEDIISIKGIFDNKNHKTIFLSQSAAKYAGLSKYSGITSNSKIAISDNNALITEGLLLGDLTVYKNFESINNPDIKPLSYYVKVDWEVPGCPINKEEFLKVVKQLLAGIPPRLPQRPVCYECQIKQNKCLLQEGLPCLGPLMLAGCGAPCPSNNYPCDGCRGPMKNVNPDKLNKQLLAQNYTQEEIDLITQRFGLEDKIYPEPPAAIN